MLYQEEDEPDLSLEEDSLLYYIRVCIQWRLRWLSVTKCEWKEPAFHPLVNILHFVSIRIKPDGLAFTRP